MSRLLVSLTLATFACNASGAQLSTPVILISVDTLRADHLGRQTPHLDTLARSGSVFSQVSTPFPLTLPAHAALLSSTYPFANGVEDNGVPLSAGSITLATVLKKAGYRTAAFVGSYVLDRRFGLSPGFDVYDGPLDLHNKISNAPVEHKRPGEQVVAGAEQWLERNSQEPFFLFLHLYDLHAPYSLPANPSLRHGETGYQAELTYVDQLLGGFFAFLDKRGLWQKSLIVFTSDHGEGLGDHGESSHGYFIYQSTLHVPLIMHWPVAGAKHLAQNRLDEPASLLDVAPTILDAVGVPRPSEMRGHSLLGGGAEDVYSESLYARNHFGCAALRGVRAGGFLYIDAPKPELYDLAGDPKELHNLYDKQPAKAAALRERMVAVLKSSPARPAGNKPASPSSDTVSALRSLGYLSGPVSRSETRVDPKDRIADFEKYSRALSLSSAGNLPQAESLLESLSASLPDVADVRMSLGLNRQRLGQVGEAVHDFNRVIELAPANAGAHFELGFCYFRLRQIDDAIKEFKATLAVEPWYTRADEALAEIYIQSKDFAQAREHLNHLLSVDPESYTGHFNLGIFAAMDKDWSEAERQMAAAVHADPGSADAHNALGGIYLQTGDTSKAQPQFEEAIHLQPKLAQAHYSLGLIFQQQGKRAQAAQEFHAAETAGR